MNKIVALQGKAHSGKTTTITLLPDILLQNGYSRLPGAYKRRGKDFLDIFVKGTKKVGVTSSGDTYDLVHARLTELVRQGCVICVCACRTADRKPPGTIAAVNSFSGYKPDLVPKTIASNPAQELSANTKDAHIVFSKI